MLRSQPMGAFVCVATLSPASRMGQLSSSVGSRSAFVALAATRLPVPIQVPRRIFSSAALAMKAERVSPCAAAGGFASADFIGPLNSICYFRK